MSHALDAIENALLDELLLSVEMIRLVDLTIRENVGSGQWDQARRQSTALVDVLKDKRTFGDAISRQLMNLSVADAGHATVSAVFRHVDTSAESAFKIPSDLPAYRRRPDRRKFVGRCRLSNRK